MSAECELLREAATSMRKRAEAATPARNWTVDVLVIGNFHEEADADHIASWHPTVALAVADWLVYTAAAREQWHEGQVPEGHPALTLARAYLGQATP